MPIQDELTVTTREDLVPGVQNHFSSDSATVMMLMRFAQEKRGRSGNGVRIADLTEKAAGQFYSGMDASVTEYKEGMLARFADWSNQKADLGIPGTYLQRNTGLTTEEVVSNQASLSTMAEGDAEAMIDKAGLESEKAWFTLTEDLTRGVHGLTVPADAIDRMPQSINKLFDEAGNWDGIGPTALGTFPATDPFAISAAGQSSLNIHEPRYWTAGTNRTISKNVLQPAINRMQARFAGFWICGLHSSLFTTLSAEWDAQIQIPMSVGEIQFMIEAVRLGRVFYFPDDYAPTDSARHLHVGMPNGMRSTFYLYFWRSRNAIGRPPSSFTGPTQNMPRLSMSLGRNYSMPVWSDAWSRDSRRADAIASALRTSYTVVCTHRAAQFEVRALKA